MIPHHRRVRSAKELAACPELALDMLPGGDTALNYALADAATNRSDGNRECVAQKLLRWPARDAALFVELQQELMCRLVQDAGVLRAARHAMLS